jgi:IS1 family transposase
MAAKIGQPPMVNETLCKILYHNLVVLIHEMCELGGSVLIWLVFFILILAPFTYGLPPLCNLTRRHTAPTLPPVDVYGLSPVSLVHVSIIDIGVEMQEGLFFPDTHYLVLVQQPGVRLQDHAVHDRAASIRGKGFAVEKLPAFREVGIRADVGTYEPCAKIVNKSNSLSVVEKAYGCHVRVQLPSLEIRKCRIELAHLDSYPRSLLVNSSLKADVGDSYAVLHRLRSASHLYSLPSNRTARNSCYKENPPIGPFEGCVPLWRVAVGFLLIVSGALWLFLNRDRSRLRCLGGVGLLLFSGSGIWLTGHYCCDDAERENGNVNPHGGTIVLQKCLTTLYSCSTVIDMANVLSAEKQTAIIAALAEGSSIRSIERITGVHRDTIMRLGVRVGQGCAKMMDTAMRDLPCNRLEMDEIWGFVGKKDRNVREGEDGVGSVWTFCAIDAETKLVPAFKCGNRDAATAQAFVQDVANRMAYRVQISTDGLTAYVPAMEAAFGGNVDYAQIIKVYGHEEVSNNRRYSAPEFVSSEKKVVVGNPDERLISTSYVERLNATTRLHMRRLTRLTLAFSKKRENFEAAVALHFAYYNFVKRHNTLRCTPAMAAGVTGTFWGVGDLLEAAA